MYACRVRGFVTLSGLPVQSRAMKIGYGRVSTRDQNASASVTPWPALSLRTPPQLDYRTGTGRAKDGLFRDPDGRPVAVTLAVFSSLSPLAVPLLLKPRRTLDSAAPSSSWVAAHRSTCTRLFCAASAPVHRPASQPAEPGRHIGGVGAAGRRPQPGQPRRHEELLPLRQLAERLAAPPDPAQQLARAGALGVGSVNLKV
jgi:hypothetical protein